MKKNLLLFSVLFFISPNIFSQKILGDFFFGDIVNIHPINDEDIIVVSNDLDHHVFMVSLDDGKILKKYIPEGRGPGESLRIESSVLIENELYLKENSGQITIIDVLKSKIIKEQIVRLPGQSNHLSFYENNLLSGTSFYVNPAFLRSKRSTLPLGYVLDRKTLEVKDTLFFDLKKSGLLEVSGISKIEFYSLESFFIQISETEYLFALKGLNKIHKMKKDESEFSVSKTYNINLENNFNLKTIERSGVGFGIKIPASLNDFFILKDSKSGELKYSFSFGYNSQNIPYGYASYNNIIDEFEYHYLDVETPDISSPLGCRKFKEKYYCFENEVAGPNGGTVFIID
tara:strand:+ start:261 stop:1292 length:1032 start_codon:yes stop_codon:yes gene_type:complete